jgi:hypothetical protein
MTGDKTVHKAEQAELVSSVRGTDAEITKAPITSIQASLVGAVRKAEVPAEKRNLRWIMIDRPVHDVFEFTVNPDNTPRWIRNIVHEEVNGLPVIVGTVYRNVDRNGVWETYKVTALEQDKRFELRNVNSTYHVRYTYKQVGDKTKLTYLEWVESGELEGPFEHSVLRCLKDVMEGR